MDPTPSPHRWVLRQVLRPSEAAPSGAAPTVGHVATPAYPFDDALEPDATVVDRAVFAELRARRAEPSVELDARLTSAERGVAALAVELLFKAAGWVPAERAATIAEAPVTWNYTTVLNVVFLILAAMLVWRAATTGGFNMLRMMNMPSQPPRGGDHRQPRHAH